MLFLLRDIKKLFKNKHIVVLGDSVQRIIYKDIVVALQQDRLLTNEEAKAKGEDTFCNDQLLFRSELNNGRQFCEVREYQSSDGFYFVQFYFLTRCYGERMELILDEFLQEPPDFILMNSCMWDISRYGPRSEEEYYKNINKLCTRMREVLPPTSMLLWTTTLPISSEIASGFLLEEIRFLSETLRVAVLEANYYVAQIMTAFGFDVLDLHFYLRALINHRQKDGVHWDPYANRHILDLICTFLHDSWGIPLPSHVVNEMKGTDMALDLRHFNYDGAPNFVGAAVRRLEALARIDENHNENHNEDQNDMDDEEEESNPTPGTSTDSGVDIENTAPFDFGDDDLEFFDDPVSP